ncbi:E1B 55K [bottlenose dolphin adenovirus 2]|uniref:E1B 55 kDa protein n=1 Tax=bottlenose dolphin adenovirus 2 TaxID=2849592 RepID=A0A0M3T9H0_9ADEN|nr:E1B 55K [Bottlenose dolphin adenovirus 1]ALE15292.1 E1B 55K [Bottlenose dolphin adenovirus 1]
MAENKVCAELQENSSARSRSVPIYVNFPFASNNANGSNEQNQGPGARGECGTTRRRSSSTESIQSSNSSSEQQQQPEQSEQPRQRVGIRRGVVGNGLEAPKRMRFMHELECITYQEVQTCEDRYRKFHFEQIIGYVLKPDDNWEEMIKLHAKIILDPNVEYVIYSPVNISSSCYIIGNSARVKIACVEPFGFVLHRFGHEERVISGMLTPTFDGVCFERDRSQPGGIIVSGGHFLLNGCNFIGSLKTCVEAQAGGIIIGCHFFACFKAVVNTSSFSLKVKSCYFERCLIGVISKGNVELTKSTAQSTYCFLFARSSCIFSYNNVINPYSLYDFEHIEMTACTNGNNILPLCSVHFARNRGAPWPQFDNNNIVRSGVYLGRRRGTFQPLNCTFHYSHINMDGDCITSVNLTRCFDQTLSVHKFIRVDEDPDPAAANHVCICGQHHPAPIVTEIDVTDFVCPRRESACCDAVFMSDNDEW